jgi:hypothetical protein
MLMEEITLGSRRKNLENPVDQNFIINKGANKFIEIHILKSRQHKKKQNY